MDYHSPTVAAFLPTNPIEAGTGETYREELIWSLSSTQEIAAECQKTNQTKIW